MKQHASRWAARPLLLTAAVLFLAQGCGDKAQSPVAGEDASSGAGRVAAAKPATGSTTAASTTATPTIYSQTATQLVTIYGSFLGVWFKDYGTDADVRVKDAWITIDKYSMTDGQSHTVKMTVYSGTTLDDVNVVFDPSGLNFSPPATLTLRLRGPATPEQVMAATHIYHDGTIESITTESERRGSVLVVVIKVPGFSRYSLGDGYWAPEAEVY